MAACPERTRLAVRHARHGSVRPLGIRSLGWMLYLFRLLSVCSHCSCHFATQLSAGLSLIKNVYYNCCRIDKSKAMSLVIHCSDISHPAKEWSIHYRWTMMLLEEFFLQVCMCAPVRASVCVCVRCHLKRTILYAIIGCVSCLEISGMVFVWGCLISVNELNMSERNKI